jgi:PAS domain S-box-containing protein
MQSNWNWDKLDPTEQQVAELLMQGKSNAAICEEVFLSRARVQDCIKRILIKTGAESTRAAIIALVEERENQTLLGMLDEVKMGVMIAQDRVAAFANRAPHQIHGYEPYEMNGMPIAELVAPRSRDFLMNQYDLRIKGEPFLQSYTFRILCKDGQEKDVNTASGGLFPYRGRTAILAVVVPDVEM